ncbi:MAG TPA: hypothetical protein DHV01_17275 [Rhodoferax sp.]|nr:hypothetical protein [Rhodoferax sp.]
MANHRGNAMAAIKRADGDWTTLFALGSQINRSHPSFDPRNYGEGNAVQTHLHVRRKAAGGAKT